MFGPYIAPSVKEAQMVAGGEIIYHMSQFPERHIDEQQGACDVVQDCRTAASWPYQVKDSEELEGGG